MTNPKPTKGQRLTDGLLVLIVLSVGVMAGAASFNHVHDWTMHNSPAHTAGWFGWANAVITELIPTAALIIIAKRRRSGGGTAYPMFLLIVAVSLSLTAQLAVARFTVFGWMVSALPALAFFALSKLVFTATKPTPAVDPAPAPVAAPEELHPFATRVTTLETRPTHGPALRPAPVAATPSPEVTAAATDMPGRRHDHGHDLQDHTHEATKTTPAPATLAIPGTSTVEGQAPVAVTEPTATATILAEARIIADAHHRAHGTPITSGQLAVRLRIGTKDADDILNQLATIPTTANTKPHNGTPIEVPA
jgi:hypothetical protein